MFAVSDIDVLVVDDDDATRDGLFHAPQGRIAHQIGGGVFA
jgi:hypothetical protein